MAAVRPSALVLDDDDDWGTISPLPTSMTRGSTFSSTTKTSGESHNFVTVGAALAGGGGDQTLSLGQGGGSTCMLGEGGNQQQVLC